MSNLLLRVTTSPPHSVFSCNAFAFCLLPSCIAASTDWLQAQLLKLRALQIVHIHHQQQDQSNPDPQAVLDLTGYLSGKAWVAVFSQDAHPSNLFCKVYWHAVIQVTHVGNLGNLQRGNDLPTHTGHGQCFAQLSWDLRDQVLYSVHL